MHGAQDRGLGARREVFQLALVRVVRITDTSRPREAFDERRILNLADGFS
jgi:hypothetical protein